MQLSKRERQLIEVFIKQGTTLTAQEIAGFCDISTKTVYRTIRKINEASLEGDIIISSSGKGFDLIYDRYLEQVVENNGIRTAASEPLSRRNNIIVSLLFRSPKRIRIDEAFGAYFVSDSVISNDLSRIESFLKQNDLNLIRNGKYISIEGHEKTIRKVVNMLISSNDLIDDQFTTVEHQISPVDINFITSLLEKLEACFEGGIPYPYKMNILSHIYILVKRFRDGGRPRESEDGFLDEEEQKLTEDYKEFYHISKKFIQKIENYLCTSLPDIEIFYLFQYLISSRIAGQSIRTPISGDLIKEVTGFFSLEAGRNIGIQQLGEINKKDLYKHMGPLLYRLKNEIMIQNDLLEDIKVEYTDTFQKVKEAAQKACRKFHLNKISEDEIGFLTVYFVKYKELLEVKRRVLIMCSSGVGTSELLKVKVNKAFPDLEIVAVLSQRQFVKNIDKYKNIDLILTTIHLNEELPTPSILVNAVFTKQDEGRVKQMLGEMS